MSEQHSQKPQKPQKPWADAEWRRIGPVGTDGQDRLRFSREAGLSERLFEWVWDDTTDWKVALVLGLKYVALWIGIALVYAVAEWFFGELAGDLVVLVAIFVIVPATVYVVLSGLAGLIAAGFLALTAESGVGLIAPLLLAVASIGSIWLERAQVVGDGGHDGVVDVSEITHPPGATPPPDAVVVWDEGSSSIDVTGSETGVSSASVDDRESTDGIAGK